MKEGDVVVHYLTLHQWVQGSIPATGYMCKWFPNPCLTLSEFLRDLWLHIAFQNLDAVCLYVTLKCWDPFGNKSWCMGDCAPKYNYTHNLHKHFWNSYNFLPSFNFPNPKTLIWLFNLATKNSCIFPLIFPAIIKMKDA